MSRINHFAQRKLLFAVVAGLSTLLSASDELKPAPPIELLATDVHVAIGGARLTLPFVALEDYASRGMSFSLDRQGDRKRAKEAAHDFIDRADDPDHPLVLHALKIVVRTYGWNDSDMRQRALCPLLTRAWAKSACDNPWAAVQQALPANRFKLVDLRRLSDDDATRLLDCQEKSQPALSIPKAPGETILVCPAAVYGSSDFDRAVIRLDGDLGALWTVWGDGQYRESAQDMANREGKAIATFVRNAIGSSENFQALHNEMCGLRRPGSTDSPKGADC